MKLKESILEDLKLFAFSFLTVLLLWMLLSDFTFDTFIGRNDATSGFLLLLRELKSKSINHLSYDPSILGGYSITWALGTLWPVKLFLHLSKMDIFSYNNVLIFLIQATIGFFSIKWVALHLPKSYSDESSFQKYFEKFLTICLISFAPLLGWRIAYGHLNILFAALSFVTSIYLIKSLIEKKVSFVDTTIAFISFSITANFVAFQMVIYMFYVLPVFACLTYGSANVVKAIFKKEFFIFIILFLILNIYFLLPFYSYYLLGDTTRGARIDIFSYAPFNLKALAATLLWENRLVKLDAVVFKWHELHYPIGIGFSSFLLFKNPKKLLYTLLFLALTLLFLFNFPGIAGLFELVPFITKMRVPARLLILVGLLSTLGATFWIIKSLPRVFLTLTNKLYLVLAFLLVLLVTGYLNGYLDLAMYGSFLLLIFAIRKQLPKVALICIFSISFVSIRAFFSHFLPFIYISDLDVSSLKINKIFSNPYERSFVEFNHNEFNFNTAYYLGIPSINGYFYASKRFSELIQALYGKPYDPLHLGWGFGFKDPQANLLSQLYNIKNVVSLNNNNLQIEKYPVQHKGIIFPEVISYNDDLHFVVDAIKKNWRHAVISKDYLPKLNNIQGCKEGSIVSVYDPNRNALLLKGFTPSACFIIVPTNYAKNLIFNKNSGADIRFIPADHALLGVIVPQGKLSGYLESSFYSDFSPL